MTDDHTLARDALSLRVSEVADGPPSLEAIYALDPLLTYSDLWYAARVQLRERWTALGRGGAWLDELKRSPPDDSFWLHSFDRKRGGAAALADKESAWHTKAPERLFQPHHYVPNAVDGVAALHVTLLFDLDPVAAVEFVSTRSSEYLIWPGARMLDIGKKQQLVDEILSRSMLRDAVLLALACTIDQQCADAQRRANELRWTHAEESAKTSAESEIARMWSDDLPKRHSAIAKTIAGRTDAGTILGAWVRHLVRAADREYDAERQAIPRIARIALDAFLEHLRPEIDLERSVTPDAACTVSRIVAASGRDDRLAQLWAEWAELVVAEAASLDSCGDVAWGVVGDTLATLPDPLEAWRASAKRLQPLLRRRARHGEWKHDDVVFPFVMSGVNGAARLGAAGKELWLEVFEFALRHFFVGQPPDNHRSFNLPAYVFGACPKVFSDKTEIEALLERLPSAAHVTCARKQLAVNLVPPVERPTIDEHPA